MPGPAAVYVGTRVRAAGFIRVYISPPLANGTGRGRRGRRRERKSERVASNGDGRRASREKSKTTVAQVPRTRGETRLKDEDTGRGRGCSAREPRAHINLLNRTSASRRISFVRALHLPARRTWRDRDARLRRRLRQIGTNCTV